MTESSSGASRTGAETASTAKEAAAALKGFSQYSAYGADAQAEKHRDPGNTRAKASRRRREFDQMPEVPFVRKADDLALATSHLAQSSSASRFTAGD
jgi:hypothetical protein